jgi:hypothetical protein
MVRWSSGVPCGIPCVPDPRRPVGDRRRGPDIGSGAASLQGFPPPVALGCRIRISAVRRHPGSPGLLPPWGLPLSRPWPDRSSHPPRALRRRHPRRPRHRCPSGVFAHATGTPPFGLLPCTSGRSPSGFVTLYSRVSKNREIG